MDRTTGTAKVTGRERIDQAARPMAAGDAVPEERRAAAMARHILRRAGIAPLVPAFAALLIAAPTPAEPQSTASTRVTATARVVVLPSSARIEAGRLIVRDGAHPETVVPRLPLMERACQAVPVDEERSCRTFVFDLP